MDVFEQLLGKHGSVDGERPSRDPRELNEPVARRGRPTAYNKLLSPAERQIVLMHVAKASNDAIAMMLGSNQAHIREVLTRPHVLSFIGFLEMTAADSIAPTVEKLNQAIESAATRAFVVARDNMEDMHEMGEELRDGGDIKNSIRAKLGAVATAQDILDRAGKRAPTRIVGDVRHVIDTDALHHLAKTIEVVGVVKEIEVDPRQQASDSERDSPGDSVNEGEGKE